jgi:predicted TIM-barrel fold metal-dependent hydrolase
MIDLNAYLGPFAFRRLRYATADGLLRLMDRAKIEQALVSSAAAITYRNAHAGNEEVAADTAKHRGRLLPCAVLNPAYAGWRDDLAICHDEFGMRAVRLYPRWHQYRLTDPECVALVQAAAARGWLITIPVRVEDRRQQSWLVDIPNVDYDEIAALLRRCPDAKFALLNGSGYTSSLLGRANNGLPPNYLIDIALLTAEMANEIGQLVRNLGEERVVFGTGIPFHYPEPAAIKLEILDVPAEVKRRIASGNARRLLGL